ncbi:MAG: DUF5658 family protein [Oscillospiraceae bacterium]|jgi:hypothetical protein
MNRQIQFINRLIIAAFLMTLADAFCTVAGIRLGVIEEANPILRSAMELDPVVTALAACAYTGGLLLIVYRFGNRCRTTLPLLLVLCAVKAAVMILHAGWIFSM